MWNRNRKTQLDTLLLKISKRILSRHATIREQAQPKSILKRRNTVDTVMTSDKQTDGASSNLSTAERNLMWAVNYFSINGRTKKWILFNILNNIGWIKMKIGSMVHTTKHQLIVEIVTQSAIHRIQTWQKRISIGSKHSKGNGKEWLEVFENQEHFFP